MSLSLTIQPSPPTGAVVSSALQALDFLQFPPSSENTPDQVRGTVFRSFFIVNLLGILVVFLNNETVQVTTTDSGYALFLCFYLGLIILKQSIQCYRNIGNYQNRS